MPTLRFATGSRSLLPERANPSIIFLTVGGAEHFRRGRKGVLADHGTSHHMAQGLAIRRPLNRRTILCTLVVCAAASSATTPCASAAADNNSKTKQADENKKA